MSSISNHPNKRAAIGDAIAISAILLAAWPVAAAAAPSQEAYPACTATRTDECRERPAESAYHPHHHGGRTHQTAKAVR